MTISAGFLAMPYITSAWDGLNFLHSSPQGAVFWICTKTALVTHWCFGYCSAYLHSFLFFSLFYRPVGQGGQEARGDRAADWRWVKGYSVPYGSCSANKNGWALGMLVYEVSIPWRLAGQWSTVDGEWIDLLNGGCLYVAFFYFSSIYLSNYLYSGIFLLLLALLCPLWGASGWVEHSFWLGSTHHTSSGVSEETKFRWRQWTKVLRKNKWTRKKSFSLFWKQRTLWNNHLMTFPNHWACEKHQVTTQIQSMKGVSNCCFTAFWGRVGMSLCGLG